MRKIKWIAVCLSLCLAFCCFSCAKKPTDSNNGGSGTPTQTVTENDPHYVNNTLHKVTVTDSDRKFIQNGVSDYTIVATGARAERAARFLQTRIHEATGASLTVSESGAYSSDAKLIVLGDEDVFAAANLEMPKDDLGVSGYYIKTACDSAFIMSGGAFGYQNGAIAFLKAVLGFEIFSEDTVVYGKDGATLPDMEIIERPDFDFRQQLYGFSNDTKYAMGFLSSDDIYMRVGGAWCHNAFNYLPPENFEDEHGNWYSDDGKQLCYSAHGKDLDDMVDAVAEAMKAVVKSNPDLVNIQFTQMDERTRCRCDTCNASVEKYGTISGVMVQFLNKLDDKIQAWIKTEYPEGRELHIYMFAYHESEKPPVKKNSAGEWEAIDSSVVCNENVGIVLAALDAKYTVDFYHEDNAEISERIAGWTKLTKNMHFWLYQTNFSHYMYPLSTYDSAFELYRYVKQNNGVYMFHQGQQDQGKGVTHFSTFKNYLASVGQFDVNADYAAATDRFFDVYFREAAEPMREFYDNMRARCAYLYDTYEELTGTIYESINNAKYWPKPLLESYMDCIDRAYAAIERYKNADPALYATLCKHIKMESMFPRYALLELHSGLYSKAQLQELREQFQKDCYELNITHVREHGMFDNEVFVQWGLPV